MVPSEVPPSEPGHHHPNQVPINTWPQQGHHDTSTYNGVPQHGTPANFPPQIPTGNPSNPNPDPAFQLPPHPPMPHPQMLYHTHPHRPAAHQPAATVTPPGDPGPTVHIKIPSTQQGLEPQGSSYCDAYNAAAKAMPPSTVPFSTFEAAPGSGEFSSGLWRCCGDTHSKYSCITSWLLPCWAHGVVGDAVAEGSGRVPPTAMTAGPFAVLYLGILCCFKCYPVALALQFPACAAMTSAGFLLRRNVRRKYGIPEDDFSDCCVAFWCHPCSLDQHLRHIRHHAPDHHLDLFEIKDGKTDLSFLKRMTAPYCT